MASIPNTSPLPGFQPAHPGELLREILDDLGVSQREFATRTGMPLQRINEIVRGKRAVSPETAWILGDAFAQSPAFWLGLQSQYDLAAARPKGRRMKPLREVTKALEGERREGGT